MIFTHQIRRIYMQLYGKSNSKIFGMAMNNLELEKMNA
jgi:hypothetical protein